MSIQLVPLATQLSVNAFLLPYAILLLPIALAVSVRCAAFRGRNTGRMTAWQAFRGFGRCIAAITVSGWWVMWDLRSPSDLSPQVARNWSGNLESASAASPLFWIAPIVSMSIYLLFCYAVERSLLKLRWTMVDMLRRACWTLVSFVIPLLMVAAGFDAVFERRFWGVAWFLIAGVVSRVGTLFLQRADGMKFNKLKSGELRNRALKIASNMGVALARVYLVPAGKGHLTNAFGMSGAIGLTDNLGKYLTRAQVDYVIAHEVAHVRLKHGRKHLLIVIIVFSILVSMLLLFSQYISTFRPLVQLTVIFAPLLAIYYFSRLFEYSADAGAVDFTGDPETAILALVNLYKIHEVPVRYNAVAELFMTHPALLERARAIANAGGVPPQHVSEILKNAGIPAA